MYQTRHGRMLFTSGALTLDDVPFRRGGLHSGGGCLHGYKSPRKPRKLIAQSENLAGLPAEFRVERACYPQGIFESLGVSP